MDIPRADFLNQPHPEPLDAGVDYHALKNFSLVNIAVEKLRVSC